MHIVEVLDLADLFNHYGTDKNINGYAQLYSVLFAPLRHEPIVLLEIGIGTLIPEASSSMLGYAQPGYEPGGSLRAWRDYFPKGRIIGVDVQPDTKLSEARIETYLCDSTDADRVAALMADRLSGVSPDIIIDDGSHLDDDQLRTLTNFYDHVHPNGLYVIEDVYPGSHLSSTPEILERPTHGDPFFFVGVQNNLCVIKKQKINSRRRGY